MARIIVTTDERERSDARVIMDEQLSPDHLSDEHAQLMQRLGWTVVNAQPRSVGWRANARRGRPSGGAGA
jgi:hypothetical protein